MDCVFLSTVDFWSSNIVKYYKPVKSTWILCSRMHLSQCGSIFLFLVHFLLVIIVCDKQLSPLNIGSSKFQCIGLCLICF